MKPTALRFAVSALLGGGLVTPAQALQLYVDSKTSQVFTSPGPNRVKLGDFEQVDEKPVKPKSKHSAAAYDDTAYSSKADLATAEEVKKVETKLNARIDDVVNKPKKPHDAKTTIDERGIRFETNDGAFKFSLNGRLHTDAAMYSGGDIATYNAKTPYGPYDGQIIRENRQSDGTEVRRFRMEFAGQYNEDWRFKMQPEFANAGTGQYTVGLRDAFVQYTGFGDYGSFTAGQSKQPYSFQQMMSSNDMVFMERSMEYVFTNSSVNRAIGLRYDLPGKWWGFSTGLYGDTATPQTSGTSDAPDEGWGAAMRGTLAPIMEPDELLHVGASAAYRAPQSDRRDLRYNFRQTAMSPMAYLDTGTMRDVQNSQFINGEMVGIWGPLSLETEYNGTWINSNDSETSLGDPAGPGYMQGAHVDVAYSLTGESRATSYRADQGVLGRIKPNHNLDFDDGWGAWELKGRFAWVDMNQIEDKSFAGGNEVSSTIGANWYWNNWSRFMLDWTHVYSLNVGQAGNNRTVLNLPGQNTGDWDVVQARIDLHY